MRQAREAGFTGLTGARRLAVQSSSRARAPAGGRRRRLGTARGLRRPREVAGQASDRFASGWPVPARRLRSASCSRQRIIVGQRLHARLWLDVHDLVAALFQLGEQGRQRLRRRGVDVVKEDDALAPGREVSHDPLVTAAASLVSKSLLSMSMEKCGEMPAAAGSRARRRCPSDRETERRGRPACPTPAVRRSSPFRSPPGPCSGDRACRLPCDQVWVATVWPRRATSLTISGSAKRHPADHEEGRLGAVRGQRLENGPGAGARGAVVEGQHDLAVPQQAAPLYSAPNCGPCDVSMVTVRDTPSLPASGAQASWPRAGCRRPTARTRRAPRAEGAHHCTHRSKFPLAAKGLQRSADVPPANVLYLAASRASRPCTCYNSRAEKTVAGGHQGGNWR